MSRLGPPCRRLLRRTGVALAMTVGAFVPAGANAASVRLRQPVPAAVRGATPLGVLSDAAPLDTTIVLRPRDPAALAAYAAAVSDPASPAFRRYLSVSEFSQRFGPTASEVATVRAALRDAGLTVGPLSPNGLALRARSTADRMGRAFGVSFRRLRLPSGRTAFANTQAPALPAGVAPLVQSIIGLDDVRQVRPVSPAVRRPAAALAPGAVPPHVLTGGSQPCSAAASDAALRGAYTADQLASTYGFSSLYASGDLGQGATIALYELAAYDPANLQQYESCFGTNATVSPVTVDAGPASDPAGAVEADLDVEDVVGLAPRANVLVYEGPNSGQGPYDVLAQMVTENRARVIATAWGLCEAELGSSDAQAEQSLLQEAAVQGQTVVAASGDNGAQDCTDDAGNPIDQLAVDDPASQPYVTGVGGTHLGPVPSTTQTVWSDDRGATGGGLSSLWAVPVWQRHVQGADASGVPCGLPAIGCREVPDVSADASPHTGYEVYLTDPVTSESGWVGVGGTSAASPLWGALFALIDASSACRGIPLGFANPLLYGLPARDFTDVTSGINALPGTLSGGYRAAVGYDMASGLGTPVGQWLASDLCAANVASHTTTTTATTTTTTTSASTTTTRSTTTTARNTITLANPGELVSRAGQAVVVRPVARDSAGAPLTFSATGLPAGIALDGATGTLTGRPRRAARARVTLSASDTSGASTTITFTWTVEGPPSIYRSAGQRSARRAVTIELRVLAGTYAPALAQLDLGVPGVVFSTSSRTLGRWVTLTSGRTRLPCRITRLHGRLRIVLVRPATGFAIRIGSGAIERVARTRSSRLTGSVLDAAGTRTALS